MRIAVISAMIDEIECLLPLLGEYETIKKGHYTFYRTTFNNHELIVSQSGVGKTAAGTLVGYLVANYQLDVIINTGICGGLYQKAKVGDIVVMDKAYYGDVDVSVFGYKFGQIPGDEPYYISDRNLLSKAVDCLIGDILTSDKFVCDDKVIREIIDNHFSNTNIIGFDMESAAFAQAAKTFEIPFIAVRAISDIIGHTTPKEYQLSEKEICMISSRYLYRLLTNL